MRRTLLLWGIAASLVGCLAASSQAMEDVPMLEPEEFPILPWGGAPGDIDALKEMRACGFNLAGFVNPEDLDLVSEAGLKCIVSGVNPSPLEETEIDQRAAALVQRVGQHPAVFGYFLKDEPGAQLFPILSKWVETIRKKAPQACAYINLFPNYASSKQMNASTYTEYLESYVQTVRPRFLSYDHYALMDDGSVRRGYFQNLEAIRDVAQRHGLPFWNTVLANAHFRYAEPTDAGLRFQLYTTLAYGGRGISYFSYNTTGMGNFRLAPIDPFGHKTRTWEMLRNVNLQLHCLGKVYLTLKSINVFHHPEVPPGCSGHETSRWLATVKGADLVVGEFEGPGGQPFVMVVNKNLHHSTAFDVAFKEPGEVQYISAYTGKTEDWGAGDWGFEHKWLAPGQGMLLALRDSQQARQQARLIHEGRETLARIMDGQRFADSSTPMNSLLSDVSVLFHDRDRLEKSPGSSPFIKKLFGGDLERAKGLLPHLRKQLIYLDLHSCSLPLAEPKQGDTAWIKLKQKGTLRPAATLEYVYMGGGQWTFQASDLIIPPAPSE